jgi:hypothetical protein
LPAYTFPAWPVGLNGEEGALAAPPGVIAFAGRSFRNANRRVAIVGKEIAI